LCDTCQVDPLSLLGMTRRYSPSFLRIVRVVVASFVDDERWAEHISCLNFGATSTGGDKRQPNR
jgi:hypothetical protein